MDSSPPGVSVLGISQARILEWVAISFSRGSSPPRDQTQVSCIAGGFFTTEPPGKPKIQCPEWNKRALSRCEFWVLFLAWGQNSTRGSGENFLVEAQLKIAAHASPQLLIPPPQPQNLVMWAILSFRPIRLMATSHCRLRAGTLQLSYVFWALFYLGNRETEKPFGPDSVSWFPEFPVSWLKN